MPFIHPPLPSPPYPPIYICLFQLYRKWICGLCLFPRPVHTTHTVNAQLRSATWPSIVGPASWTEQYFRLVYTTPAARESICRLCTGKYHLALVFRYSILFTIKSVVRLCHLCVGRSAAGWLVGWLVVRACGPRRREGVRYGLVFDGGRERESLSFCRNKTRLSNQARPRNWWGQQPLSPLWNACIYQRAEESGAKDSPYCHWLSPPRNDTSE